MTARLRPEATFPRHPATVRAITAPRPLAADCPSATTIPLPDPGRANRAAINPSIAADPAGGFRMIIRHVNYRYTTDGSYVPLDGSGRIVTDNVLVTLDDDLRITSSQPIDHSRVELPRGLSTVQGFEDMRLFTRNGTWFASATVRDHRPDALAETVLLQLDGPVIASATVLSSPFPGRHEKNWMPIEGDGPHRFLWRCDPPVVATVDEVLGTITTATAVVDLHEPTAARGGSQVIRIDDRYLAVVHHVHWVVNDAGHTRHYRHRFVLFDNDLALIGASPEFVFEHHGIEFCAGLAPTRDGVVVSYGIGDHSARLMTVDGKDLWRWIALLPSPGV